MNGILLIKTASQGADIIPKNGRNNLQSILKPIHWSRGAVNFVALFMSATGHFNIFPANVILIKNWFF